MCRSGRWVTNRYDQRDYFVKCGHCEACQQEKALRRMARIDEEMKPGIKSYFVTFTYKNKFVPYVLESEYKSFYESSRIGRSFCIYRNGSVIETLDSDSFVYRNHDTLLSGFAFPKLSYLTMYYRNGQFVYLNDRVGVLYMKDAQRFFNYLQTYLKRIGYNEYFSYYYTGEYGGERARPHIHALIYFKDGFDKVIYSAICKCWSFSDLSQPFRQRTGELRYPIELAIHPTQYVSTYLNKRDYVPKVLSATKPFKMFYHFSEGFGTLNDQFSLSKILEKTRQGYLTYIKPVLKDGVLTFSESPIPNYVLGRYFPKFKGYSRLDDYALVNIARSPQSIYFRKELSNYLTNDEKDAICKKFVSLRQRIPVDLINDWSLFYPSVLRVQASNSIRRSYRDVTQPEQLFTHFYNIYDYLSGKITNLFLDDMMPFCRGIPDSVNDFPDIVQRHQDLCKGFHDSLQLHQILNEFYEKVSSVQTDAQ